MPSIKEIVDLATFSFIEFSIVLESVLAGHEGWINGVQWARALNQGIYNYQ